MGSAMEGELPIEKEVEGWYPLGGIPFWGLRCSVQSDEADLLKDWHVIGAGTFTDFALQVVLKDSYQVAFKIVGEMLAPASLLF